MFSVGVYETDLYSKGAVFDTEVQTVLAK